ncbi:PGAP1-like protein-domain-containing protein [Mycena floridula]|nr:PGAP1-like protein-domain-containing protein [Mycena floridula]
MFRPALVAVASLLAIVGLYLAVLDTEQSLSPQGCRMSYMSPSYVLQSALDVSWTPLAARYSLWLYREQGWEAQQLHRGVPVLFIPGNAGSSRQVRSIASSAARQFFPTPFLQNGELIGRGIKPLDFFAVEFNEDLSAFHGPTMEAQTEYTSQAISYILSLYPADTKIIVMGHSMGGIVATSLLDATSRISAIITMSTPHTLPPARFDHRIDEIYDRNLATLNENLTPILSICGGATDMMIPSESCILPVSTVSPSPWRRTIFSSALEGAWTGVGHREVVWCHQVRWRVARAALELATATSNSEKGLVLDRWLSDGHQRRTSATDAHLVLTNSTSYEILPSGLNLVLKKPRGSHTYLLPRPAAGSPKLVLYVSQGSIPPVSPQNPLSLTVSVFLCNQAHDSSIICNSLRPTSHKLIPNPDSGATFPVPDEGSDESEGVALFEADVPEGVWVGVKIENADENGWVLGGFNTGERIASSIKTTELVFKKVTIETPDNMALRTSLTFPNLISNVLLVYRIVPQAIAPDSGCLAHLLPPLLVHKSHESEIHYFPLSGGDHRRILLHTHGSAPFIKQPSPQNGLSFDIYSSGSAGCLPGISLGIDWTATFGRWASRYFTALATWSVGLVALIIFHGWGLYEKTSVMPSVHESLTVFGHRRIPRLLLGSFFVSFLPLSEKYLLGNSGNPYFAVISPLLLLIAFGLVCVSWWILIIALWSIALLRSRLVNSNVTSNKPARGLRRSTVISMCFIFLLVFLLVPWQVAFLACWIIQFGNCVASTIQKPFPGSAHTPVPLATLSGDRSSVDEQPNRLLSHLANVVSNHNHNTHILLLMTWLLPLAAPVLVVWVRTLATAGLTTPFQGDHFVLNVAPFVVLADFASWNVGPLFEKLRFENLFSLRYCFVVLAGSAFFIGPRRAYFVFDVAKISIGLIVALRIGKRYWGTPTSP